jgi:hypothetical protein
MPPLFHDIHVAHNTSMIQILRHLQFDPGYRTRLPGNPRSKKWLGIEWLAVDRSHGIKA